ncbi:MAG: LPS-assembly protein LptD [Gallionella sp.]
MPATQGEMPAELDADRLVGQKNQQIEATGDAVLRQDGKTISADRLIYTPDNREVDAQGNVMLEQQGDKMSGPHLHMNMDTEHGKMEQPEFQFEENNARATAVTMDIIDRRHYNLNNATYTTCPAGNDDWYLRMNTLELDRVNELGTARGATVEFKGVPFVYAPWMDFPLNDHRKSGFLSPTYASTSNNGLDFTLPYYWNIAPNMDATLAPRLMFKRGVQFNNEFRYLNTGYSGMVQADILPGDRITNTNREHFMVKHNQVIANGVTGFVDYNRVLDDAYYRDLSTVGMTSTAGMNSVVSAANIAAQVELMQQGGFRMNADGWNSLVQVQRFQTLQDPNAPIVAPYARMPQLTTTTTRNIADASLAFTGDYTEFSHPTMVNGKRLVLNPSISYPLVSEPAYYVTPKLTLSSTQYMMGANNNAVGLANSGLTSTTPLPNVSRNLPLFSLDSGMSFERDTNLFGGDYIQTLEPRAYYVYVPYRNQDMLPNFDSALADFNMVQMFTENRFVGNDRIGDANQVTLATTTRLLAENNGAERLRVTLGERFSFTTPQVNLVTPVGSTGKSDILLAVGGGVSKKLYFDSLVDFDPNQSKTQQYSWIARYRPEPGKTFNFGYQYQRFVSQQVDMSGQWPISRHWDTVAKINYSFPDKRILDSIAGVEYNEDCWTARVVIQHYNPAVQQSVTGLYVQLDLNNFMQAGDSFFSSLKQEVPGYTKTNINPAYPNAMGNP